MHDDMHPALHPRAVCRFDRATGRRESEHRPRLKVPLAFRNAPLQYASCGAAVHATSIGDVRCYYQTTLDALHNDGDILVTLDVLARQVGIRGIFSDWSATVTYYANCMGLK